MHLSSTRLSATRSQLIASRLDAVRHGIRRYVWIHGLSLLAAVLAAAFWLGLAIDWIWEPSRGFRIAGWIAVGISVVAVLVRYVLRRAFAPLPDSSLALLLERSCPDLNEALITSVELGSESASESVDPILLSQTVQVAEQRLAEHAQIRFLKSTPVVRACGVAVMMVGAIGLFAIASREAFGFYLSRLALSDQRWPRHVQLEILNVPTDSLGHRTLKVAPDDQLEIVVHANLTGGHVAPEIVEIRYRQQNGQRGRDTMTRIGDARIGHDNYQKYRYVFRDVAHSLDFDIVGGDDRIEGIRLMVVPRPRIVEQRIFCDYPSYMRRQDEWLDVTGSMLIPHGTALKVSARATKPLRDVRLQNRSLTLDLEMSYGVDQNQQQIQCELPPLTADDVLSISLVDQDGISTRQPTRISLIVVQDEPPQVAVRPAGIGSAITAQARIPFRGTVSDPRYGIRRVWFEVTPSQAAAQQVPIADELDAVQLIRIDHAIDLRDTNSSPGTTQPAFRPGDKLTTAVHAADFYDLSPEQHVGASPPVTFEIVTPENLRALLERRELVLRQRLESIYERMTDTRNLLARLELPSSSANEDAAATHDVDAQARDQASPMERRQLRIASALQNVAQATQEILGVADGFDEIQQELINNRIDTEPLLARLRDGVSVPLHELARDRLPALENRLQSLQIPHDDPAAGGEEQQQALEQTDHILVAIERILANMLQLESYNEVLDLLRGIISEQNQLNQRTRAQQKQRLRGLRDE